MSCFRSTARSGDTLQPSAERTRGSQDLSFIAKGRVNSHSLRRFGSNQRGSPCLAGTPELCRAKLGAGSDAAALPQLESKLQANWKPRLTFHSEEGGGRGSCPVWGVGRRQRSPPKARARAHCSADSTMHIPATLPRRPLPVGLAPHPNPPRKVEGCSHRL